MHTLGTIGIIGGGQLGKMLTLEAKRMALDVVVLDPDPDCPCSTLCKDQIVAPFKDQQAIRTLAQRCQVVTYEIEQGDWETLDALSQQGLKIYPSAQNLKIIQDKFLQKEFLQKNAIPAGSFRALHCAQDLIQAAATFSYPFLVKKRKDAYDGRGNQTLHSEQDLHTLLADPAFVQNIQSYMAEKFVAFVQEISVMVARNAQGQLSLFPVAENIHRDHILQTTLVPARISQHSFMRAQEVAREIVESLDGVGIFGIEMFLSADGEISVNEVAPRTHNSGHYTIESCTHSQFEMQLRAILNWPLVDPVFKGAAVMINILGKNAAEAPYQLQGVEKLLAEPGVKLHWYGKTRARNQRKMGHITILETSLEKALEKSERARSAIKIVPV